MQPPDRLDGLESRLLDALARDEVLDPFSLTFLVLRYRETGSSELAEPIGRGLAAGLQTYPDDTSLAGRAAWLALFIDARALSDDDRVHRAVDDLIGRLVEDLERFVGSRYRPGHGIAGGTLADQIHTASALLTAYSATGRLPYAMLAEELMQIVRRGECRDFSLSCDAARVFCRLAMLHADDNYRQAAVLAADADYRADAHHLLIALAIDETTRTTAATDARYALALAEYTNLQ